MTLKQPLIAGVLIKSGDTGFVVLPWTALGNCLSRKPCLGFASGIDGPRVFKQEGLPVGPSWADVERLIMSASGDRPRDIRDHAILLLFAFYALRSAEVAALRLEDLDWEREIIVVARPKQRRAQEYPLVHSVGEAIVRYLQQVRPRCASREIFLTLKAPFRPLSAGALYHLGQQPLVRTEHPEPAPRTTFAPACLCRTSAG
jgi:integrase